MSFLYNLSFLVFGIFYLPIFLIKLRQAESPARLMRERLGLLPVSLKEKFLGKKIIWIHAVSVGEVMAVRHLIACWTKGDPSYHFVLTTVTPTGQKVARQLESENERLSVCYFPFDWTGPVRRFFEALGPECLLLAETEIWPNLLTEASRARVPVGIINGRLSARSAKNYLRFRRFFSPLFQRLSFALTQTQDDAARFEAVGLNPSKIHVVGNMKFDAAPPGNPEITDGAVMKQHWGFDRDDQILIAGSTHPGEEQMIARVFMKLRAQIAALRLVLVPRHIERAKTVKEQFEKKGICVRLASERLSGSRASILILDQLGVLRHLYAMADAVIMGGSFVKRGGQNPIEPAYHQKAILHGPHVFNFYHVYRILNQEGGALAVRDEAQLEFALKRLLTDESERRQIGRNAYVTVRKLRGATERHLEWLFKFLGRTRESERISHVESNA